MVFVGFEDGSKAIRYWDKATRKIKVLRNVAFNKNEEPTDLDGEVPGISAEGENRKNSALTLTPETSKSQDTQVLVTPTHVEPETRNLQARTKVDYKKLNNPPIRQPPITKSSGFTIRIPRPSTPATPPDVTRPTDTLSTVRSGLNQTHRSWVRSYVRADWTHIYRSEVQG